LFGGERVRSKTKIQNRALAPKKKEQTMKNQFTVNKSITRSGQYAWAVAGLLLLAAAASAPGQILPPQSHPYGHTYADWLAKWWQWSLAFPADADPGSDTAPQDSAQSGHVWFLAGVHGNAQTGVISVVTRDLTMPAGRALFFPVLSTWTDNSGCPTYTDFTVPELEAQIAGAWSFVTETTCTIDGVPVAGLGDPQTSPFLIQASVFSYTVASHDNLLAGVYGEPCIPDGTTVSPAVALGVCVMLAPLSPGQHTIHFVGVVGPVATPFVEIDVTYNINVVGGLNSDSE
jgi:hypothetical protein